MFKHKVLFSLLVLSITIVTGFHATVAHAAVGDIQLIVNREADSTALVGATVLFRCAGGTFTALTGNITTNGSGIVHAAPQAGSDCQNGESVDVQISKTGYVTQTIIATNTYNTGIDNIYGAATLKFPLKVVVADELGNSVNPDSATLRGSAADLISGNTVYFADESASGGLLRVIKDGYVASDTVNISGVSTSNVAQVVVTYGVFAPCSSGPIASSTSCTGLQFSNKVTSVTPEVIGAAFTSGVTVKTGDSFGTTCIASGSAWYCAIPLANTSRLISVAKDGYVTNTASSFASDRTSATDAQITGGVAGVQYALKVSVVDSANGGYVTGATVTAGDGGSITCTESTGVYYCAIPIANTATTGTVMKSPAYIGLGILYTDRTSGSDPQGLVTATVYASVVAVSSAPTTTVGGGHPVPSIFTASANTLANISGNTNMIGGTYTIATPSFVALTKDVTARSSKDLIKNLQSALNTMLGDNLKMKLIADGRWGAKTTAAMKLFQKGAGIKGDGTIAGPMTREKINESLK